MKFKFTIIALLITLIGQNSISQVPIFQSLNQNVSGTQLNEIISVDKDVNGNIFFCGRHTDTVTLGSVTLLPGQGGAFWGKSDPTGNIIWLNQGGTLNAMNDRANNIVVDQNGDIYVCGAISGFQIASFNGTPLPNMYPGFVVKYSNNGNFIWASGFGSNIFTIAIDNLNAPIINEGDQNVFKLDPNTGVSISSPSGSISGNLQNPHWHNIEIDGSNNIIVQAGNKIIKFDTDFNQLWSTPVTSSLQETFRITLDQSGNVFGSFYALFGSVTIGTITKSNFPNSYIYQLDAVTGNPLFVDSLLISSAASKIKEIISSSGNYYVSGDGAFNTAHVLKITSAYSVLWDKTMSNNSPVNDIDLISEDCLILGGNHQATVALDSYTLTLPNGITNTENSFVGALCDGGVGIIENVNITAVLYPNPVKDKLSIRSEEKIISIDVYSLQGNKICSEVASNEINLNHLAPGTYFVKIKNENGLITQKIVLE